MDKVLKEEIINKYKELRSVWKVSEFFNLSGQTIHKYLTDWGEINKINLFTNEEKQVLIDQYEFYKSIGKLQLLADRLGRTKQFICRKAKELGLTGSSGGFYGNPKKTSDFIKKWIEKNGHPKGMKGKKHTDSNKKKASERLKKMWSDTNHILNSEEMKQLRSDNMSKYQANKKNKSNNYSRTKKGWWESGDRRYYMRSSWEHNYAYYLDYLVSINEIKKWEYEPDTFWFDKIKRGIRSYTPDFKIFYENGDVVFHEVKGWLDDKSKTKLKRMAKYHPDVKLILIHEKEYKEVMKLKDLFLPKE